MYDTLDTCATFQTSSQQASMFLCPYSQSWSIISIYFFVFFPWFNDFQRHNRSQETTIALLYRCAASEAYILDCLPLDEVSFYSLLSLNAYEWLVSIWSKSIPTEPDSRKMKPQESKPVENAETDDDFEDSLDSISSTPKRAEADDEFDDLMALEDNDGVPESAADDAIISDADEKGDLNSEEEDEEEEDEDRHAETGGCLASVESGHQPESLQEELKRYLPPPCPLDLAENPLLHMPPQVDHWCSIAKWELASKACWV